MTYEWLLRDENFFILFFSYKLQIVLLWVQVFLSLSWRNQSLQVDEIYYFQWV